MIRWGDTRVSIPTRTYIAGKAEITLCWVDWQVHQASTYRYCKVRAGKQNYRRSMYCVIEP